MKAEQLEVVEEPFVDGIVSDVSRSNLTIETDFGWCSLPLDEKLSSKLFVGMHIRVTVDGKVLWS